MLFKFRYRGKAQVRLALRGSHRYRPPEYCRPRFATEAGLTPVEIFDVDSPFIYPHEATAVRGLNSSGGGSARHRELKRAGRNASACQGDRPLPSARRQLPHQG